ncbi:hypothetical protein, partial [Mycobacteroides abscessus]|uniref:hypothetical protein n=1 Tax=Mycobacteroides abscessus TaxID=36809 RepID=UPI001A958A52
RGNPLIHARKRNQPPPPPQPPPLRRSQHRDGIPTCTYRRRSADTTGLRQTVPGRHKATPAREAARWLRRLVPSSSSASRSYQITATGCAFGLRIRWRTNFHALQ